MQSEALTVPDIRKRLATLDDLRTTGTLLRQDPLDTVDGELVETFHQAFGQLDSLENDLRVRLGRLAPGDPQSLADLDALQDRLAEREARQEMGVATEEEVPSVLELTTGEPSWGAALGIGTFGFAWTSFTTFHCVMMIGGMVKSFGWGALALLGFYSIFFLVGFAMLYGAFLALCRETVRLEGGRLTVHRRRGRIDLKKTYTLMPGERAVIGPTASTKNNESGSTVGVLFTDEKGKEVAVGTSLSRALREKVLAKINAYLAAQESPERRRL